MATLSSVRRPSPCGDRKGGAFHAGEKPGEQSEKRSEGAQRAEEPEKRPQVSRRPSHTQAARSFPGRSACQKSLSDTLNKFSELYKNSENLGFQWRGTPFLGYLRAKSRLAAVALRNTPAGVVPRTPFLTVAENLPLYRQFQRPGVFRAAFHLIFSAFIKPVCVKG